jgi:hypothetical protein
MGNGAFLAMTINVGKKLIGQLDDALFLDNLLAPSSRFIDRSQTIVISLLIS